VPLCADVKVNKGLDSSVDAVVRGDLPPYIGQSWTNCSYQSDKTAARCTINCWRPRAGFRTRLKFTEGAHLICMSIFRTDEHLRGVLEALVEWGELSHMRASKKQEIQT